MASQASLSKTLQKGTGTGASTPMALTQQGAYSNGMHRASSGELGDDASTASGRNAPSAVVRPRSAAALASSQAPEWETRWGATCMRILHHEA